MVRTEKSALGSGTTMGGQQFDGKSTEPFLFSRPERHDLIGHTTLLAELWRTIDEYPSSQDESWLSDEERSFIGSDFSLDHEYLTLGDIHDPPE